MGSKVSSARTGRDGAYVQQNNVLHFARGQPRQSSTESEVREIFSVILNEKEEWRRQLSCKSTKESVKNIHVKSSSSFLAVPESHRISFDKCLNYVRGNCQEKPLENNYAKAQLKALDSNFELDHTNVGKGMTSNTNEVSERIHEMEGTATRNVEGEKEFIEIGFRNVHERCTVDGLKVQNIEDAKEKYLKGKEVRMQFVPRMKKEVPFLNFSRATKEKIIVGATEMTRSIGGVMR